MKRNQFLCGLLAAFTLAGAAHAQATAWPTKPNAMANMSPTRTA